jgi:4-carboxymuconolactone decarboxylase
MMTFVFPNSFVYRYLKLGEILLLRDRLFPRDRELAILRIALRTECEYEWENHTLGALRASAT